MEPAEYCRALETYLCRKNGGHLVRIVGPAFEMVSGWAATGIPLKVAYRGIDRCCDRRRAAGSGRRRPVRIEFCETDILDVFEEWRRAIGVAPEGASQTDTTEPPARKPSLPAHLERVLARIVAVREGSVSPALLSFVDDIFAELTALLEQARQARGEARERIVTRLAEMDGVLIARAAQDLDPTRLAALRQEALEELAPFGGRMPGPAFERAVEAAVLRLVRESLRLPEIAYV